MRATERITAGVIDRSGTDEDLRVIEIERGTDPRSEPKGGSKWVSVATMKHFMTAMGEFMNVTVIELMQIREAEEKRNEESSRLKSLEREVLELLKQKKQAKIDQLTLGMKQMATYMKEMEKKKIADVDAAKEAREGKVAAKIWEPEEDPDRKDDGLHPQIGPFALRGQLEIAESECPRGGTYGGGSS
jgi:hypothetical protein